MTSKALFTTIEERTCLARDQNKAVRKLFWHESDLITFTKIVHRIFPNIRHTKPSSMLCRYYISQYTSIYIYIFSIIESASWTGAETRDPVCPSWRSVLFALMLNSFDSYRHLYVLCLPLTNESMLY